MKKLSIFLLIFSMILSSITSAYSQPKKAGWWKTGTATIQGQVTNSVTNQAISGAAVKAGRYRVTTDTNGNYIIKNIKVWFWGRIYRVKASANGYYSGHRWIYVRKDKTYTLNFKLRPRKPLILVKIDSPEDNSYIRGTSSDVLVAWQGRAGIIDLYLDDSLAGSYRTWRWWHRAGNHTFNINISSQEDGEHKLKAIAYRSHKRRGYKAESKEITFILDNTSSVISDISPANDALINDNQPEISAVLSDATSGIDKETVILKLDDAEVTAIYDEITGKLSYTPETALEDGSHTISIEVKDRAGNEATASSTFRVETDTTPPSITDLSPKDASTIYYTTPTISAKYSDDKSGIDKTTVKILVNAVDVTASSTITDEDISYAVPDGKLTEGGVTVNIEAKDNAGNLAAKEFGFEIKILTAEEALELVKINHDKIQDMKATLEGKSTYKSQPYGKGVYADYWYKYPDNKKTKHYTSSARNEVESISILADTALHYINPSKNIRQTVDILEGKEVTKQDLANANPIDNLDSFINANDVTRISNDKWLYLIEATPKEENSHYNKISLYIDTSHSLLQKTELYKDNNLKQITEISSCEDLDGIYVASETKKIPVLEDDSGDTSLDFITTLTYSNIEINTGIPDSEFDPEQQ